MLNTSGTPDEIAHHIPAGVILLKKGDFKMDTSQPPLSRYIIAAPVVFFLKPGLPDDAAQWRRQDRGEFGRDFFFKYNHMPKKMLFAGRLAVLTVSVLCGILLFVWAKQIYGAKAGIFGLFLYCLSPNILANSALATTDMIATFFIFLSCYMFWRFLRLNNWLNLFLSGIALGMAQLSKYSSLILYPIFFIFIIIGVWHIKKEKAKKVLLQIFLIFVISVITIWAGYGFKHEPILKNTLRQQEKIELVNASAQKILPFWNEGLAKKTEYFLRSFPMPLGEHIIGILGVLRHSRQGHATYFLGSHSEAGNKLYFTLAFLIKTPIPTLLLLALGIYALFKQKFSIDTYYLVLVPVIYFIAASAGNLQIGLRHILPIYPFCFIIAAGSVSLLRYKFFKIAIPLLCAWLLFNCINVWPNYISYFNESIGGPKNGWRYLRDSNIDWGQDLPALSAYMKKNNINDITLEYFGEDDPALYGIKFNKFNKDEYRRPQEKVYAVSVNYLDNVEWAKDCKPVATAGNSIFVYIFKRVNVS